MAHHSYFQIVSSDHARNSGCIDEQKKLQTQSQTNIRKRCTPRIEVDDHIGLSGQSVGLLLPSSRRGVSTGGDILDGEWEGDTETEAIGRGIEGALA